MKIGMDVSAVPCASFVQRSIEALANDGHRIYIYAQVKGNTGWNHPNMILRSRPQKGLLVIITFLKRFLYLMLNDRSRALHIWKYYGSVGLKSRIKEFNRLSAYYIDKPDIIHIQWTKAIIKLAYLLENKPAPIIVSVRGTQLFSTPLADENIHKEYKRLFPLVDTFHVISEALSAEVKKYSNTPTCLIDAAIDSDAFPYRNVYTRNSILRLVTVTRFNWIKGMEVLLDALTILKTQNIPFHLTIIASDKPGVEYMYHERESGLKPQIQIKHQLTSVQIAEELETHDLFVLPSLSEGRSNALLEAMSSGVPVLCADFAGARELIVSGQNGWIFNFNDPQSLAASIVSFMEASTEDVSSIRKNARHTIEKSYKQRMQLESFTQLYQSLLKS